MATVPVSGTNIRLLSNIPFTNDYKNTRWFDSKNTQTSYFTNKNVVHSMTQANFQRIEGKHFIAVNKSIDELWSANYLMFQNAEYNSKWFYAFITKLEYVQKKTTYVHFQIDVFQTWKFDMNFKPSFVVREHRPLWNSGKPVVNTIDEGLNYGTDYDTVSVENIIPQDNLYFLVIVTKSRIHGTEEGEITASRNGIPQPLCYYVHPFRLNGTVPNVYIGGNSFTISPLLDLLSNIFSQDNAVNNIVSMYVTDFTGMDWAYDGSTVTVMNTVMNGAMISDNVHGNVQTLYVADLPEYVGKNINLGDKYSGYHSVNESKLLMYPYTVLILDDFKGNRVELKNEFIDNDNLSIQVRGSMGLSNKVTYAVLDYQTENLNIDDKEDVSLEFSLINNNPNDISIISDYLSAYLQGNRNTIEHQKTQITVNGMMNAIGGSIGMGASKQKNNPIGFASGLTNTAQGMANTVLELQGIEEKIKDINNIPPQMAKMGSNTAYDYGYKYTGLYVIKKQIKSEYRKILGDFFNMFGYKTNEVKVPNFHTRQNWNYVQTESCIITGNFNNEDLQELKSVFDNGITLWHTDDVGNYSLSNGVI